MNVRSFLITPINIDKIKINDLIKRSFDFMFSLIALILLAPVFGVIGLAIKRDTPGPVFYRGLRLGLGGKNFRILKFRTMFETPDSYAGPKVTAQDDPRVTSFGSWLRNTKLNELPQFWNVLIGEMSLVGPRPEDPSIAEAWPVDMRKEILSVRPGITSPATVQYHNEEALLSSKHVISQYIREIGPDKLRLDQLYVRYRSFWLDMDVLLWTVLILFPMLREYAPPEKTIFLGPITRIFKRYINWFTIDLLTTFSAMGVAGWVKRLFGPLDIGMANAVIAALAFALIFSFAGAIFGLNRISWSKASLQDIYDILRTWGIAAVVAIAANLQFELLPTHLVLIGSIVALCGFVFMRYPARIMSSLICRMSRFSSRYQAMRERILIVGTGRTAEHITWLFDHPSYSDKFQVVGLVDDNLLTQGMRIYGVDVVGTIKDIPAVVQNYDVGIIALADHRTATAEYRSRILEICAATSAKVVNIPDLYGSIKSLEDLADHHWDPGNEQDVLRELPCRYCLANLQAVENGLDAKKIFEEVQNLVSLPPSIQLDEVPKKGGECEF